MYKKRKCLIQSRVSAYWWYDRFWPYHTTTKGLKGKARIPTGDLIPKTRRCINQHYMALQIPSASVEAYKCSFFPQTIWDWNVLPESLIASAELSDDCVSKFSSFMRVKD